MSDKIYIELTPIKPKVLEKQAITVYVDAITDANVNPVAGTGPVRDNNGSVLTVNTSDLQPSKVSPYASVTFTDLQRNVLTILTHVPVTIGQNVGTVQQKAGYPDAEGVIIPSAIAIGKGSVAFGGRRFDKPKEEYDPETGKTFIYSDSIAQGEQSIVAGGSNFARDAFGVAMGQENKVYRRGSVALGGNNVAGNENEISSDPWAGGLAVALGEANNATGRGAIAAGGENKASGMTSVAFGAQNTSFGYHSVTIGSINIAQGDYAQAFGRENQALALDASAFGTENVSVNEKSISLGFKNTSRNYAAFTLGTRNNVSGRYAGAIGFENNVSVAFAYTLGYQNIVTAEAAAALGYQNKLSGYGTCALGYSNTVATSYSVAIGWDNDIVPGSYASVAIGYNNTMNAHYAFVAGLDNTTSSGAAGEGQAVVGRHAAADDDAIFVVGNGGWNNRKNAFVVKKDNTAIIGGKKIATEEYVDSKSTGSGIVYKTIDLSDTLLHNIADGIESGAYEIEIWAITNGGNIIQPFNLILMDGMTYSTNLIQVRFHASMYSDGKFIMFDRPTAVSKVNDEIVYSVLNGSMPHDVATKIGVQVPTVNDAAPSSMAKVYVKYTKME